MLSYNYIIANDITDPTPYEKDENPIVGECAKTGKNIHADDEIAYLSLPDDCYRKFDKVILAEALTSKEIDLLEAVGFSVEFCTAREANLE